MGNATTSLKEYLKIGFIQTVVNEHLAWPKPHNSIHMGRMAEKRVWYEIRKGFCNLKNDSDKPDIIVLPELSIPNGYLDHLKKLTLAINAVVIGGLDFECVQKHYVKNRAVIIIPNKWPSGNRSYNCNVKYFGKTFFSKSEIEFFNALNLKCIKDPVTYIINAGELGIIGVAICSDFYDIERFVVYKGKVHHIIVISYNQDIKSYNFLAEAISRLVYCNVIICNTGYYGNSLAFVPYNKSFERVAYKHSGQKLFTTQIVKVPVESLDKAQRKNDIKHIFKSTPPGYEKTEFP